MVSTARRWLLAVMVQCEAQSCSVLHRRMCADTFLLMPWTMPYRKGHIVPTMCPKLCGLIPIVGHNGLVSRYTNMYWTFLDGNSLHSNASTIGVQYVRNTALFHLVSTTTRTWPTTYNLPFTKSIPDCVGACAWVVPSSCVSNQHPAQPPEHINVSHSQQW